MLYQLPRWFGSLTSLAMTVPSTQVYLMLIAASSLSGRMHLLGVLAPTAISFFESQYEHLNCSRRLRARIKREFTAGALSSARSHSLR